MKPLENLERSASDAGVKKIETEKKELLEGQSQEQIEKSSEQNGEISATETQQPTEKKGEAATISAPIPPALLIQQQREAQIDRILSEGLEDIYNEMSPEKKKEFREEGEKTVKKINELLGEAKVKIKKIIDLIRGWLAIIPGVNRFFLEQEAKIRADRLINLKKDF